MNNQKFTVTVGASRGRCRVSINNFSERRVAAHRSERRGLKNELRVAVENWRAGEDWDFNPNVSSRNAHIDDRDVV